MLEKSTSKAFEEADLPANKDRIEKAICRYIRKQFEKIVKNTFNEHGTQDSEPAREAIRHQLDMVGTAADRAFWDLFEEKDELPETEWHTLYKFSLWTAEKEKHPFYQRVNSEKALCVTL
ncbi:MAG: hypothetical protein WD003_00855 [Candidatus Paceibacterota bacterium]